MKRFSVLLSALALIVLMQGCGNGPSIEPEIPDNPTQSAVQLRLKGNIASLAPSTRVNADGFEANDKVGVYVSATGALASSGNMLDNTAFTYSSGNLTAPEGKEVYWGSDDVRLNVWAYYPYHEYPNGYTPDVNKYVVTVDQEQQDEALLYKSDFLLATASNLAPQEDAVELNFKHLLSKVDISLSDGEGITAEELTSAAKELTIEGLYLDGYTNLATGEVTCSYHKDGNIYPAITSNTDYSAIVIPQEGLLTFRLRMGGYEERTYTTEVDFKSGYQYQFNMTVDVISDQQLSLQTVTIDPWQDGNVYHGSMPDVVEISDTAFKEYLLSAKYYEYEETPSTTILDDYYAADSGYDIDRDHNGVISISEAEKVVYLNVENLNISDMSSIKYFPNLECLLCSNNQLTSLDLSRNLKLKGLDCSSNQLTTLDVSKNTALKEIVCNQNQLEILDVSKNKKLGCLYCTPMDNVNGENLLTTLYLATGQEIEVLNKPEATKIEYK